MIPSPKCLTSRPVYSRNAFRVRELCVCNQIQSLRVSKPGGHASRVLQIGKHDRTRGRINLDPASAMNGRRIRDPSQERLDHRGIDFDDLVGDASVCLVMCLLKCILVGGVHQAKHFRTDLINPIRNEANAVFALDCQVLFRAPPQ